MEENQLRSASSPSTSHPEKQVFDAMNDDNASSGFLFKVERVALGPREIQDEDLAISADHNLQGLFSSDLPPWSSLPSGTANLDWTSGLCQSPPYLPRMELDEHNLDATYAAGLCLPAQSFMPCIWDFNPEHSFFYFAPNGIPFQGINTDGRSYWPSDMSETDWLEAEFQSTGESLFSSSFLLYLMYKSARCIQLVNSPRIAKE